MTKEWFPHDYATRNKTKMAVLLHEQKARGYGLFWIIVEMLYEGSHKWMELEEMTYIAIEKQSGESSDYIKTFIDQCISRYKVFSQDGNQFTTERVLENIDKRLEISGKRSEAGRKSGEARKGKGTNGEQLLNKDEHLFNSDEQTGTEKRRGEKRREEEKRKKNYTRPKGLTAAFAADHAELRELKKEYDQFVQGLPDDQIVIWTQIKSFVAEKKPSFLEPYVDLWNIFALSRNLIKMPIRVTEHRRRKLDTRIREPGFDFIAVLQIIKDSRFLKGGNDRKWKVSFEYIIDSEENYTKILEEKYE